MTNVVELPVLPVDGTEPEPKAQHAPARTRERKPRLPSPAVFAGLLAGTDPLAKGPPSILTVWERHAAAARYYRSPWARYPRYAYGAWHSFIETPLAYLFVWSGDSFAKRAGFALLALVFLILFHKIHL